MRNRRVLVTGGAGFIGSNVANALAPDNDVVALDDRSLGTPAHLDDAVEFVEASVLDDPAGLPTDVDVVIHLAARSSYAMHEGAAADGAAVNVEGFATIVDAARRDGCDTVVFASTSSVYGDCTEPTPEDVPIEARTAYEASKLSRERYGEYYANHYGMNVAALRYFSVYEGYGGAEAHKDEYANVVAQFTDDIAHGRRPEIYGDGSQTRDFTHVDDVARATIAVAEAELTGPYNVGTGESYDFDTVVELLNEELGTDVEPKYVENPIPDHVYVHDTCADASKLRAATGWAPEIDFETGVERVCVPYT